MDLKTYRAHSMAEALAEVKKDLGRDAVILHTRTYKVGGVLGVGARQMVEITASSSAEAGQPRPRSRPSPGTQPSHDAVGLIAPPTGPGEPQRAGPVHVDASGGFRPEVFVKAETPVPAPAQPARYEPAHPEQVQASAPAARPTLEEEMCALKRMMAEVLQSTRRSSGAAGMPDALFDLYMRLIDRDVETELADRLVGQVRDALGPDELGDERAVRATLLRRMAALMPATGRTPPAGRSDDGRPRTVALVGPTGVGKTTTLAKLAANYKLRQGRRVGLVTSDTYRIAAVEQLRTYATIIGLPLRVVLTPGEIADACAALDDVDIIFIDTAGRSPNDGKRVDELREFVESADPHERHLVLSATSNEGVLMTAVERFAPVRPDCVIFTKLDEAERLGTLVNVLARAPRPISFVTSGQEVPDDLDLADPDRLARLVLDGGTAP